jgi:Icc-related predicted phosphoesterase
VRRVTLYYAADIHGSERCWRKFLNAGRFYGADVLILGGDVTGKMLVPIVRRDGGWVGRVLGRVERAETRDELTRLLEILRVNGLYPYVCDDDEYDRLEADEGYRRAVFSEQMRCGLARWVELADERLRGSGIEVYVMPGNDDEFGIEEVLAASEVIVNPEGRVVEVAGALEMVSCGWANPTPWHSPRECPDEELEARIRAALEALPGQRPALFNLHVPPYASGLDRAPRLTEDLRPVMTGGEMEMVPVGSRAVDAVLREHQPLLSLHGHIHESRGIARIGETLALDPGSRYGEGVLDGALITIAGGKVIAYQLVSG